MFLEDSGQQHIESDQLCFDLYGQAEGYRMSSGKSTRWEKSGRFRFEAACHLGRNQQEIVGFLSVSAKSTMSFHAQVSRRQQPHSRYP